MCSINVQISIHRERGFLRTFAFRALWFSICFSNVPGAFQDGAYLAFPSIKHEKCRKQHVVFLMLISLSVNDASLAVKPQTHSVVSDIHIFSTQLPRPPCDMLLVLPTTSTVCPTSCLAPRPYEHYPSYDHYPYHGVPQFTVPSYPSHLNLLHKPSARGSECQDHSAQLVP